MNKMNRYLVSSVFSGILLVSGAQAMAKGEPMYDFLPSDTVVDNVKNNLQSHGVDVSAIQVDADTQGVVRVRGEVASKQEVESITQIAQQSDGVYAVLGSLRYETGEVVPAPVPGGLDPVMDAPAAGNETSQQQINAQ
jgi:hypothetical protein